MYVIGCDVGSQSLKGILLDASGSVLAQASADYPIDYPQPGWAQQDALSWRAALAEVIGACVSRAGVSPTEVASLALASQVDGLVAVDADGDPLAPAIIWLDRRATAQAAHLRNGLDAGATRRRTGLNVDASHGAPKIMWLRECHAQAFERAAGLLLPGSALVAWMTGERVVDHANASSTLLYDINEQAWSPEMLEAAQLDAQRLGTIRPATDVVGHLTADAASTLGLTTATRVMVGTGDEHGAALGAGGIVPDVVIDITGTAEPVCVASRTPTIDDSGLVETHGHADPRVWLVENPGFVSGGSVSWFLSTFGGGTAAVLDAEASTTPPGADGVTFLPTLSGATAPRWNDAARGVFAGLSLNHGRGHLFRSVLEGCTFALRDIVDRLETLGLAGPEMRVVGGGARSPLWLQMKADVTGRTVRVLATDEATAMGAAMLASVGAGFVRDLDEAVERDVRLEDRRYEPDPSTTVAYTDSYARYRRLFDAVEPTFS
jgi:xylulokinase